MEIKYSISSDLFGSPVMTIYDVPVLEVGSKIYDFENIEFTLDKEQQEKFYRVKVDRVVIDRVLKIIIKMVEARWNTLNRAYNSNNDFKLDAIIILKKDISYLRSFRDKIKPFADFINDKMINNLVLISPSPESMFYANYKRQINILTKFIKKVHE